jgi:hypothetical protein
LQEKKIYTTPMMTFIGFELRRPHSIACLPSLMEYVIYERCERNEGEANIHRHYPAIHLVQEQLVMAGHDAGRA